MPTNHKTTWETMTKSIEETRNLLRKHSTNHDCADLDSTIQAADNLTTMYNNAFVPPARRKAQSRIDTYIEKISAIVELDISECSQPAEDLSSLAKQKLRFFYDLKSKLSDPREARQLIEDKLNDKYCFLNQHRHRGHLLYSLFGIGWKPKSRKVARQLLKLLPKSI